ncbi:MAG: ABC transporter ATP-binding protein [Methanoregulaceae archaeon]
MTRPDPVIRVRDLSFRYPKTLSGREVTALRHVSLVIQPGEFTVISGPSGSGKSTLARCLNGLIPHATKGAMDGDVIVLGMNTREYDIPDFARHVGMVFQDPGYQLVTGDVESEIAFGLEIQNLTELEIHSKLERAVDLLHISHLVGRTIHDLSWGERQRVAIASVLAVQPSLLVMDEPFSGIDASAALNLVELLAELRKNLGTTIIVFEHRTAFLRSLADRVIVMQNGEILSDGKPCLAGSSGDRVAPPGNTKPPSSALFPERVPPRKDTAAQQGRQAPVPVLSFRNVVYQYPGTRASALEGISLDFYPGEITILYGANGSGKTTLLKHCNGLLTPDRGYVLLGTNPLSHMTVAETARTVGLLNQHADYQLFESTITEELAFGPRNLGKPEGTIEETLGKIRNLCSLGHIDPSTPPLGLSGGEKQRVALASILAMETPIIILDEPTFGLDPGLKRTLVVLFRELCDSGKTVIVATHDKEFGEACGDRFIRISSGRVETEYRKPCRSRNNLDPPAPQTASHKGEIRGNS